MKNKWIATALIILPVAAVGAKLATSEATEPKSASYVCPITGEELPCPNCCPLNK